MAEKSGPEQEKGSPKGPEEDPSTSEGGGPSTTNSTKRGPPPYPCPHCPKVFKHFSYFTYHLRTHLNERPYSCHLCPGNTKSFFERSKLNRHLSSCHSVQMTPFYSENNDKANNTCDKSGCGGRAFKRKEALQQHLKIFHGGERPFKCSTCGKGFSGRTALKGHEKGHQSQEEGQGSSIPCEICGKGFLLKKYLDLHLSTVHKMKEKLWKCGVGRCSRDFHSRKDLLRHQLSHSEEKRFQCRICGTKFKRKDNLNRHLKLTHSLGPDEEEEPEAVAEVPVPPPPPPPAVAPIPIRREISVIKSTQDFLSSHNHQ